MMRGFRVIIRVLAVFVAFVAISRTISFLHGHDEVRHHGSHPLVQPLAPQHQPEPLPPRSPTQAFTAAPRLQTPAAQASSQQQYRPRLSDTAGRAAIATSSITGSTATVTAVYYRGLDRRYPVFRIPALVRVGDELLAFAEARPTVDDHGRIDLVVRRSVDGGQTWGPLSVVVRGQDEAIGNPVPVVIPRASGTADVLLVYCSNPANVNEDTIRAGVAGATRRVWMVRSGDGGVTWSAPAELTSAVKRVGWTWYATGPGGAVVTAGSDGNAATITIPATHADGPGPIGSGLDHSHVLISTDSGSSWRLGGDALNHTNEATIAALPDGTLLLNSRDLSPLRRRVLQLSHDGGATWSELWRTTELTEPPPRGCHGSMVAAQGSLFFTGLASTAARARLSLWRSVDGGHTWPWSRLLHAGPAAYSSMRVLANGTLGVLYERGESRFAFFAQRIVFERIELGS